MEPKRAPGPDNSTIGAQVLVSVFFGRLERLMGGDAEYARLVLIGMLGADLIMLPAAVLGAPHAPPPHPCKTFERTSRASNVCAPTDSARPGPCCVLHLGLMLCKP